MFQQAFNNIDNIFRQEAGCTTELDYTEQTSWLLFLKYLDDLEAEKAIEAELTGKPYHHIIESPYRWEEWAAPKAADGSFDHNNAMTGDDLIEFVDNELFTYLMGFKQKLYLLINGPLAAAENRTYKPVEGKMGPIAEATVDALMTKVTQGSVYRMWVLAMVHGADFHLSYVPPDFEFTSGSLTLDPEEQTALFERGYQQALEGAAWATQVAPASTEELIQLIADPASTFDRHQPPAWLLRGGQ